MDSEPDTLVKLELTVPAVATEAAVVALAQISPQGFEEHGEDGPPPTVRFVVYGEPGSAAGLRAAMDDLVAALGADHVDGVRLVSSEIPQQNWREAWKVHFTLQRVEPFVIRPSWIDYTPAAGEHLIHLDPGSAFGTGIHETTRLCLRALAALDAQGRVPRDVLDFGCGTGILSIGACLLWACDVVAVDDDPYAISACEENAERNGLVHRIRATRELPATGQYEVVLANVSCPVLVDFAGPLADKLAPGGRLVLSGLLVTDREAIGEAYRKVGLEILGETQETDWLCLVLGRSG